MRQENKQQPYSIKTILPISIILLFIIVVILLVLSFFNIVWLFYLPIFTTLYYILFCRYGCYITANKEVIQIIYIAPWLKNVSVRFEDIKKIDYERSGYNLFSSKRIGAKLFLPQYCYDRLIVYKNTVQLKPIYFNVNTFIFGFNRIIRYIKDLDKM